MRNLEKKLMANTAEIRRENTGFIKQTLSDGKEYTARSMAEKTGLSVATCNTILKNLAREGIAVYVERQLNEVGRKTCIYKINSLYDSVLYVRCLQKGERKYFSAIVNYAYGGNRGGEEADCEDFSYDSVELFLKGLLKKYVGIVRILLGLPFAEDRSFGERLEQSLSLPVIVDEETAYIARAYRDGALACFFSFEPEGIRFFSSCREQLIKPRRKREREFLSGTKDVLSLLLSLVELFAPDIVVFTGDRIDKKTVDFLAAECEERMGKNGLPRFCYKESLDRDYFFGMVYTKPEEK